MIPKRAVLGGVPADHPSIRAFVWLRSVWLGQAVRELRPYFRRHGVRLPTQVVVGSGVCWEPAPAAGRVLGQCWRDSGDKGAPLIRIARHVTEPRQILPVLVHELVHAANPGDNSHGPSFAQRARLVGLVGPWHATAAGPVLAKDLRALARRLGPYPVRDEPYAVTAVTGQVIA